MSASSTNAAPSGSSSLRPAWHKGNQGGRGFQPPPSVDSRTRSTSLGSEPKRDVNKFSALQDDDNEVVPATVRSIPAVKNEDNSNKPAPNSRSEAFRSSFRPPGGGRTLTDLAARVPEAPGLPRSHSTGYAAANNSGRFSGLRSTDTTNAAATAGGGGAGSIAEKAEAKIIRYTREKLLSMRPPPKPDAEPPEELKGIEGSVILSKAPLDPVCWDTLDADEIWSVSRDRRAATTGVAAVKTAPGLVRTNSEGPEDRRSRPPIQATGGRWERGVALPPPDENKGRRDRDADHPDDLWDDPVGGAVGAASDFSAFGAIPDDPLDHHNNDVFDFEKMAEMSKKFEEELHGSRKSSDADLVGNEEELDDENMHSVKVDPKRPLASAGTTIRSGSGDHVNVFEDFDDPGAEHDEAPIKGGDENPSSSSRLMKMIGVNKDESDSGLAAAAVAAAASTDGREVQKGETQFTEEPTEFPTAADHEQRAEEQHIKPALSSIPSNPWGGPMASSGPELNQHQSMGLDLAARLAALAAEQKARDMEFERKAELLRLRQEQEEAQRRAVAQEQAEEQARQQAQAAAMQQQQQQQASGHSQVELVLMERICRILENSWGRSDLVSILSTLHSEDSRVIPLLGTADALRALIARHPQRVALRHDPAVGAEMAVLGMTNAQWQQQQQQQQAQARAQQEELQRREQQRRLLAVQQQQQQEAAARAQAELLKRAIPALIPNAPWYYTDPQNSIQGPFRGDEMRQWLEAGYFKGDLPISQQATGPFQQLSSYFPDMTAAFTMPQNNNAAEEEARARAQAEEEEHRRRQMQLQREDEERQRRTAEAAAIARAEAEATAEAERRRISAEANRKLVEKANGSSRQDAQEHNESSHQLKMMLGLGNSSSLSIDAGDQPVLNEAAESHTSREPMQQREKPAPKPPRTQQRVVPSEPEVSESQAAAKSAAPAWGGAATSKAVPRKSMSEIQQEEARAAERLAVQRGSQPGTNQRSHSGWANVAASGTTAWSGGSAKPTAAAVVGVSALPRLAAATPGVVPPAARPRPPGPSNVAIRPAGAAPPQQRSNDAANVDDFGASMAPTLERWCKDQMIKLNGSEDLTLVSFCMTLDDPVEIRQYLTTYLGSTPQVNNFATEFINKKAGKGKQDEWETPAAAKKGKKKSNNKGGR